MGNINDQLGWKKYDCLLVCSFDICMLQVREKEERDVVRRILFGVWGFIICREALFLRINQFCTIYPRVHPREGSSGKNYSLYQAIRNYLQRVLLVEIFLAVLFRTRICVCMPPFLSILFCKTCTLRHISTRFPFLFVSLAFFNEEPSLKRDFQTIKLL